MTEELAVDGVTDALQADHFLASIQIEAVAEIVVAAKPPNYGVSLPVLLWRHVWERAIQSMLNGWPFHVSYHFHLVSFEFWAQKATPPFF
jgi:hypothetical protein